MANMIFLLDPFYDISKSHELRRFRNIGMKISNILAPPFYAISKSYEFKPFRNKDLRSMNLGFRFRERFGNMSL